MYAKTFRIDPDTGECFGACLHPGRGDVICSLYGSQMPHTIIARRQLVDGTWEGRRFTHTAWEAVSSKDGWLEVYNLVRWCAN